MASTVFREVKAETVFYHGKGDRQKHLGLLNEMMIDTDDRYKLKYEIEMGIGQWPMANGHWVLIEI